MKTKDYVTQKMDRKLLVSAIALVMGFLFYTQDSDALCNPDKIKQLQMDTKAFMKKIEAATPAGLIVKAAYGDNSARQAIMDGKFHAVDTQSSEILKPLDAVGVVTAKAFDKAPNGYGSGILINPCFVLTNRHVVKGNAEDRGEQLAIGSKQVFSVGQNKTCESDRPFREQNITGKVIDFGSSDMLDEDWAIIQLDKPVTTVTAPKLTNAVSHRGDLAIRVGFPFEKINQANDPSKISAVRAQFDEVTTNVGGAGTISLRDQSYLPGLSGGGIFKITKNADQSASLRLFAIHGGADDNIEIEGIIEKMKANGRGTLENIVKLRQNGSCNPIK